MLRCTYLDTRDIEFLAKRITVRVAYPSEKPFVRDGVFSVRSLHAHDLRAAATT